MGMKLTIRKKMLLGTVCPLIMLGIAIIAATAMIVTPSMKNEIKNSLRASAIAVQAAYDQNAGDYYEASNGDVWKGGYNISKSYSLVDEVKANSGMDVTFFYGSRRVVTSALDSDGNRITGSPAGDKIIEHVLNNGEEYFSEAVSMDGVLNYGYYVPVYQSDSDASPVGMVFVGTNKAQKDAVINDIVVSIIVAVAVVMVIGTIAVLIISGNISGSIKKNVSLVQDVANGNLNTWIDEKYLKHTDEVGDLARALKSLRYSIKDMVKSITDNSQILTSSSDELAAMAQNTISTLQEVEASVNRISDSVSLQARDTQEASNNVNYMGELISDTSSHVDILSSNADVMKKTGDTAFSNVKELMTINGQVREAVEAITAQTNQTNASVQKIKDATNIITSIADETSLLSLNASIEAARAGEAGRGFAVVAGQIQKLAEQSNEASGRIDDIVAMLIADSNKTVDTMNHVKDIIERQNESMQVTENAVSDVMEGIDKSLESIGVISDKTGKLDEARNNIVSIVNGLSETADKNAQETKETSEATHEVYLSFEKVADASEKLKGVAGTLADGLGKFRQ